MTEELSKNALKKQLKAEEAAKKKAAKAAEREAKAATQGPAKAKLAATDEADLDPTQYFENRSRVINQMGVSHNRMKPVLKYVLIIYASIPDRCLSSQVPNYTHDQGFYHTILKL